MLTPSFMVVLAAAVSMIGITGLVVNAVEIVRNRIF